MPDLQDFFLIWDNPESMLNKLAWCELRKPFHITVDTDEGAFIVVQLTKTKRIYFEEVESGLYLFKNGIKEENNKQKINGYFFLTFAEGNTKEFTRSQIGKANVAKELHQCLGFPSYKKYFWL